MANGADIELLVKMRLVFLEADESNAGYSRIKENCGGYFQKALREETCDVVLAEENGACVGTGIVFYYDSVPSVSNPTGKNAYITSIYVAKEYRRRGVGRTIVTMLQEKARERGYAILMLNASEMGRHMYEKMGFSEIHNGMILRLE